MIRTEKELLAELARLEAKKVHTLRLDYLRWILCLDEVKPLTTSAS